MSINIIEINSKKELRKFVEFQIELYKNCPYFVPPIIKDEIETFLPGKNPALELSDCKILLALKNDKIAGRVVAINNKPANEKWKQKNIRFNWFDCIDDFEVAEALFAEIEKWARSLNFDSITGPHGFTDLDPQGLLIEGYDKIVTIASYYHYPYYKNFLEKLGFQKEIDYLEFLSTPPYKTGIPKKLEEVAEYITRRNQFRLANYPSAKDYVRRGEEIFEVLDEAFSELYGTVPLNKKQVLYYIKKYITYINKDFIKLVLTKDDQIAGFLITMPNLSEAFQKAKGKLLPFGFYHILKGMKNYKILDFYLAGVRKAYRDKGVDVLMALDIVKTAMKYGFEKAESNQELETNSKVQAQWKFFEPVLHRRRRIYKKILAY